LHRRDLQGSSILIFEEFLFSEENAVDYHALESASL
jgi:hypothetical protein